MSSTQRPKLLHLSQVVLNLGIRISNKSCNFDCLQTTSPLPCCAREKLPTIFCHEDGSRTSWTSQRCWKVFSLLFYVYPSANVSPDKNAAISRYALENIIASIQTWMNFYV